MKITKYGQCCLLIEVNNLRILTDPGRFSRGFEELADLDLVLITHEHPDHIHAETMQAVVAKNPGVKVITNSGVGKVLNELGVSYELLEGTASTTYKGVALEAFDGKHVEIFEEYGQVQNTGYFIAEQLFYPGDAYTNPQKTVPVLALPVSGPWCQAADALHYALEVKPDKAFPVHDAVLNDEGIALVHGLFESQLKERGVEFIRLNAGESKEF